jgi:uncharacterized membrane protein
MNLEDCTSSVLRCGSLAGVLIAAAGIISFLAGASHAELIATAGIAVIVFTPFAGMIASFAALSLNKERKYAMSALMLIAVTLIGIAIAYAIG